MQESKPGAPREIVAQAVSTPRGGLLTRSLPLKALEGFCQRMGIGLRSGVDIMRILEQETRLGSSAQRQGARNISELIRGGYTLADSLKLQGGLYPHTLVQMVMAGEAGGSLERVFLHMSGYFRDLRRTRGDFIQKVSWPIMQMGLALLILSAVIWLQEFFATPSAHPDDIQFDASGLGLRGTKGLITLWSWVFGLSIVFAVTSFGIWKNWGGCHKVLLPAIRNIPVIGTVFTTLALSRLSMTLSMLLNAGVDARRCIREAFLSTGNYYYISGMPVAEAEIEKGQAFATAFDASGVMPREFIEGLEIGEMSGTETNSLERLAAEYQERSQIALARLASITSNVIWVGIAMFLIFVIVRMFMQYISVLTSLSK